MTATTDARRRNRRPEKKGAKKVVAEKTARKKAVVKSVERGRTPTKAKAEAAIFRGDKPPGTATDTETVQVRGETRLASEFDPPGTFDGIPVEPVADAIRDPECVAAEKAVFATAPEGFDPFIADLEYGRRAHERLLSLDVQRLHRDLAAAANASRTYVADKITNAIMWAAGTVSFAFVVAGYFVSLAG